MIEKLTSETLGTRIREAREAKGLTQAQLAAQLGLGSHQPVLRMEKGERSVSTIELTLLVRLLGRRLSYFVSTDISEAATEREDYAVVFRAGGLPEANLSAVQALVSRVEQYSFLHRALGRPPGAASLTSFSYRDPTTLDEASAQAEEAANSTRPMLGLDVLQPIHDLVGLLQEQGLGVFAAELPPLVSGLSVSTAQARCIVVNAAERPGRNAFTIAHELGHLLFGEEAHVCGHQEGRDLAEARADRFASALLLPKAGLEWYREQHLRIEWRQINALHVAELQFHFRTSYQAVLVRLRRLGLIGERLYSELNGVSRDHLHRLTGHDEGREIVRPDTFELQFRSLAVEAYRRALISRARLADMLGVGEQELVELLRSLRISPPRITVSPKRANPLLAVSRA